MRSQTLSSTGYSGDSRLHVEQGGHLPFTDQNLGPYDEYGASWLNGMGSYVPGRVNSICKLTKEGFEQKASILACAKEAG